jgi:hypothetical protein
VTKKLTPNARASSLFRTIRANFSEIHPVKLSRGGFPLFVVHELHPHRHSVGKHFDLGAKKMFKSSLLQFQERGTAEEKLWRAVITKSLEEWICGPLSFSRKAEQFLFEDKNDFQAVCSSAGMDADRLRNRLKTLRARGIQKESIPFRARTQKRPALAPVPEFIQKAFGV